MAFNVISGINGSGGEASSSDIAIQSDSGESKNNLILGNFLCSTTSHVGINLTAIVGEVNKNRVLFNYVTGKTGLTGHGIIVYSAVEGLKLRNNTLAHNVVEDIPGMGAYVQGNTANKDILDTIIEANQFVDTVQLGTGAQLVDAAIGVHGALRTIVRGNIVTGGGVSGASGIRAEASDDTQIDGNHLSGLGSFTNGGIVLASTSPGNSNRARITNNVVEGAGHASYRIGTASSCYLQGNVSADTRGWPGYLIDAADDVTLIGNVSRNDGVDGIRVTANASRTRLLHNTITGILAGTPIYDGGTATERFGNRVSTGPWQGQAELASGTATVSTAEVLSTDVFVLNRQVAGGTLGHLSIGTITPGVSFVINSSDAADTSTVSWEIHH